MSNAATLGHFVWLELHTPNLSAAKAFYHELFGWESQDIPLGENDSYTFFHKGGRTAAAAYESSEAMVASGIPPHWLLYIGVADADAAAQGVAQAGGEMIMPVMEVMGQVKIGAFKDPTGAHCSLCQLLQNPGLEVRAEAGGLVWADLMTPDADTAAKFYCDAFGWTTYVEGSPYIHFKAGEAFIGGSMPGALPPGVPPHWSPYIQVDNCDDSVAKVKALGGQVFFGPHTMENVGRMATIADPTGAAIALWQAVPT